MQRTSRGPDEAPVAFVLRGAASESLRGALHVPEGDGPHPCVALCHGMKGFAAWGFYPWLAEELARAGMAAIRFDFSHNGVGEDGESFTRLDLFARNRVSYELEDLRAITEAIERGTPPFGGRVDPVRLSLFGHSRGGAIALLAAAVTPPRHRALVTWSAISHFDRLSPVQMQELERTGVTSIRNARTGQDLPIGRVALDDLRAHERAFDLIAASARLAIPWLIVHGGADETVPVEEAERLHAAGTRSRLHAVPDGDHVFGARHPWMGPTAELRELVALTVSFLASASSP